MKSYKEFLESKVLLNTQSGFEPTNLNKNLFDFQKYIITWTLKKGKSAIFANCGLGKSICQLEWANQICNKYQNSRVLIIAPLMVVEQTKREGIKFGIDVNIIDSLKDVKNGINITNYEKIDKFNCDNFIGVVLDESSILKNFTGSIKTKLITKFKKTKFKLCCTATPAPNDHLELGNHCDFLNIMPSNEMIARWFINDTMAFGSYKLKGHATKSFWEWVSSWAISLDNPSDIGFDNSNFILPKLIENLQIVKSNRLIDKNKLLFRIADLSATGMHKEMRLNIVSKTNFLKSLIKENEVWTIWCNTNYEADELKKQIKNSVEIRGNEHNDIKKKKILSFINGDIKILITKPKIAGFGMNLQHCNNVAFIGVSYSFESYYQAIRRFWRFGQKNDVNVYIIVADTEMPIYECILKKQKQKHEMHINMLIFGKDREKNKSVKLETSTGINLVTIPKWLINKGDNNG